MAPRRKISHSVKQVELLGTGIERQTYQSSMTIKFCVFYEETSADQAPSVLTCLWLTLPTSTRQPPLAVLLSKDLSSALSLTGKFVSDNPTAPIQCICGLNPEERAVCSVWARALLAAPVSRDTPISATAGCNGCRSPLENRDRLTPDILPAGS